MGKNQSLILGFLFLVLLPQASGQHAPPTLSSVVPQGGQRGTSVMLLLDGTNLEEVQAIIFNQEGLSATIDSHQILPNPSSLREGDTRALIQDGASRDRFKIRVQIAQNIPTDVYHFRLLTPYGVTNSLPFAVGPFPEVEEIQLNNSPRDAQFVELPVTVRGDISSIADVDHFRFWSDRGERLVFRIVSAPLGSRLNAQLSLLDQNGGVVDGSNARSGSHAFLTYEVPLDGEYVIRIGDKNKVGAMSGFEYRLEAGEFPLLEGVFPLGVQRGIATSLKVWGSNLGGTDFITFSAPAGLRGQSAWLSVPPASNRIQIAIGVHREEIEREPNNTMEAVQDVTWPLTVNGHIHSSGRNTGLREVDQDVFRFKALKGQILVLEIEAARFGSSLDSLLEVWDDKGRRLRQAEIRCLAQTEIVLNSPTSLRASMRLASSEDLALGDYLMVGSEIVQIQKMPQGPDDDTVFRTFLGFREALFGTTAEAHTIGDPVYKVELFPPGRRFSANGMPVFHLNYRNDDGGFLYKTDSRLEFKAPTDGTYLAVVQDVRGQEGQNYAYRLTIRERSPDFQLVVPKRSNRGRIVAGDRGERHFNIPAGGRIAVDVAIYRLDGFDGEVQVKVEGLPRGVIANPAVVPRDAASTVILLEANSEVSFPPSPIGIVGYGRVGTGKLVRQLEEGEGILLSVSSVSDLSVFVDREKVQLEPGDEVRVRVDINRHGDFKGRVPVHIRNLPYGIRVLDVGLNGVLVNEGESSRVFTLFAEPWVRDLVQPIYIIATVETKSPISLEHAAATVQLQVGSQSVPVGR